MPTIKRENVVDLTARREAPAAATPLEIFCANHRPGDPIPDLRDVDPLAYRAAFMRGWLSVTKLDEFEMIGRLEARHGIKISRAQAMVWRHRKKGPPFHKAGVGPHARVFYLSSQVDLWAERRKAAAKK